MLGFLRHPRRPPEEQTAAAAAAPYSRVTLLALVTMAALIAVNVRLHAPFKRTFDPSSQASAAGAASQEHQWAPVAYHRPVLIRKRHHLAHHPQATSSREPGYSHVTDMPTRTTQALVRRQGQSCLPVVRRLAVHGGRADAMRGTCVTVCSTSLVLFSRSQQPRQPRRDIK